MRRGRRTGRLGLLALGAVFLSGAAVALPSTEPRDREAKFRTWMATRLAAKAEETAQGIRLILDEIARCQPHPPGPAGYEIWAKEVMPLFRAVVGK